MRAFPWGSSVLARRVSHIAARRPGGGGSGGGGTRGASPATRAAIPLGGPGLSRNNTITGAPPASASSCSEFPTLDLRLCSSPARVFFPGNDSDSNPASRALLFGATVAAFSACHLIHRILLSQVFGCRLRRSLTITKAVYDDFGRIRTQAGSSITYHSASIMYKIITTTTTIRQN